MVGEGAVGRHVVYIITKIIVETAEATHKTMVLHTNMQVNFLSSAKFNQIDMCTHTHTYAML